MLVRSELDTDNGCSPAAGCCVQLTLRVVDKIIRKEFQRHEAAESRVLGSVGYPHHSATPASRGSDTVRWSGRSRQCAQWIASSLVCGIAPSTNHGTSGIHHGAASIIDAHCCIS
jgi:hypothetical protein